MDLASELWPLSLLAQGLALPQLPAGRTPPLLGGPRIYPRAMVDHPKSRGRPK